MRGIQLLWFCLSVGSFAFCDRCFKFYPYVDFGMRGILHLKVIRSFRNRLFAEGRTVVACFLVEPAKEPTVDYSERTL